MGESLFNEIHVGVTLSISWANLCSVKYMLVLLLAVHWLISAVFVYLYNFLICSPHAIPI